MLGTLWITHYLTPDIQGEVSDAFIIVLTAHQLSSLGLAQYLIVAPKSDNAVAWNVLVFQTLIGILAFIAVIALRNPIGHALHAEIGPYVPTLVVAMLIERVSVVPERLLARELKFRVIGLGRTAGELAYTVSSVGLAMAGWGGMSIAWGNVLRSIVYLWILARTVPAASWLAFGPLSWTLLKPAFRYGIPLWVGAFSMFASRRWDNLVISVLFGESVVGTYNLAYNLADIPATQVGEQIGDVLFPSFSRMEPEDRKRALLRATGLLSLIVFPLAVGLGVVAPTIVRALLRPEWQGVGPMLAVLSALSVVRPIGWTVQSYLQASNRAPVAMRLGLLKIAALLGLLFAVGYLTQSPLWACAAVGLAFGLHSLASMFVVARADGIGMLAFVLRGLPALAATLPMAVAVLGVRRLMKPAGLPPGLELAVEIAVGVGAFLPSAFFIASGTSREFLELVRAALQRRRQGMTSDPPLSGAA